MQLWASFLSCNGLWGALSLSKLCKSFLFFHQHSIHVSYFGVATKEFPLPITEEFIFLQFNKKTKSRRGHREGGLPKNFEASILKRY